MLPANGYKGQRLVSEEMLQLKKQPIVMRIYELLACYYKDTAHLQAKRRTRYLVDRPRDPASTYHCIRSM